MDSVYERALTKIGANGKFQLIFDVIFNFVFACFWSMAYNNIILALVITPHMCNISVVASNSSKYINFWKSKYIPRIEDNTGRSFYNSCSIYINPDVNNVTKECDSYLYNQTWYESTIPSTNNWVCNDEIYVANVFAYTKIGEAIGSLVFGWYGDIYGRRLTYISSLGLLILGRIISILGSSSYILFVIGCIVSAFPSWSAVQSLTVTSMEISSQERRSFTATLRTLGYSLGMCIMPLLYWWLKNWKPFMIVTTITQILFFLVSWKMIESPRWLWIEGRSKHCVKELKRIAKVNNRTLDEETQLEFLTSTPKSKDPLLGPLSLFSGWNLAMKTILQLYLWVAVSLNYNVLIMSSGEKKDGNPFLEFAWQSVVEIPATFTAAWLADKIGRRYSGAGSYFLCALIWVLICFRENGGDIWLHASWVGSALIIINRLSSTISYYVIYLLNMELYPTCLRQSGMSLGNVFSSGGSALAMFLMYAGRRIDPRIPGAALSSIAFLGVIASCFLPETLNTKLPETLSDAQKFGSKKLKYNILNLKKLRSTQM